MQSVLARDEQEAATVTIGNGLDHLLPEYFDSLNDMSEAEKTLTDDQFEIYRWILWEYCKSSDVAKWHRNYLNASAAERAEAFGLALNLWSVSDSPIPAALRAQF